MDRFDLVAEHRQPPGAVFVMCREDFQHVAAHPEGAAMEIVVVAPVLQLDEAAHDVARVGALADLQRHDHLRIGFHRADTVDAGHRGDDDHVVALEQRPCRGVAHPVDLLVDRGVLLDIGVGARDVGFRLVVVVIGDEILDRVVGEEALHLAVELCRQRLVRRQHQRRALHVLDHLGDGEGLAGPGDAEQHLVPLALAQRPVKLFDRLRLVARGLVLGNQVERNAALRARALIAFGRRPRRDQRRGAGIGETGSIAHGEII